MDENGLVEDEEAMEKRKIEQLEDMMSSFGTNPGPSSNFPRPGPEEVKAIRKRLLDVARVLGLELDLSQV